ncbi:MAG: hypothetical protein Q9214_000684 [Letrouitia sp. 1 TL-2023]
MLGCYEISYWMKPTCGQCQKAGRECRPSDGVVFRHQQNASMNADEAGLGSSRNLNSFYAYKNTFGDDSVWLDIPKHVTFVNIIDPYADPPSPETSDQLQLSADDVYDPEEVEWDSTYTFGASSSKPHTRGLEALSTAALYIPQETDMVHQSSSFAEPTQQTLASLPSNGKDSMVPPTSSQAPLSSSNRTLEYILNPPSNTSPPIDPSLEPSFDTQQSSQFQTPPNATDWAQPKAGTQRVNGRSTEPVHRNLCIDVIRMDLFDLGKYFGAQVPVKAVSNLLLKHAACAYAAKQLGRVGGRKATVGGASARQASMELWVQADQEDWGLLAAKHYDKAISLLMKALQWDQGPSNANSTESIDSRRYAARTIEDMTEERRLRRRLFGSSQSTARSDDVLGATAMLCAYEFLDASNAAWARHLSGTKSLFDVVEVGVMPLELPSVPESFPAARRDRKPSKARRAIFWNFARQDFLSAFINECQTRLDTEDIRLWREAGLLLDENDLVIASNSIENVGESFNPTSADGQGLRSSTPESTGIGLSQQMLLEQWTKLKTELDVWFNGVPETFMPTARITTSLYGEEFVEIWHSLPMCAATVLSWHMAQVLLLINKPHETTARRSTVTERLKSYRTIQAEMTFHSREICGICLARPEACVRIHSLQPLFVAGQCLTRTAERKVIHDLLRGIETDLGWATEYRVRQLHKEWGWEHEENHRQG